MGRKLLKISYLGTNYCGWQVQPNGTSVQSLLCEALENLLGEKVDLSGCSRTDAGVHAEEFYCHFDTYSQIPNRGITLGLNTMLPYDISVLECTDVARDFHARYNAKGKTYRYEIYFSEIANPFWENRKLRLKREPDFNLAKEFCTLVLGEHNFVSFSSVNRTVIDTVRTITECRVEKMDNCWIFSVTADGFLYNMVRILVGSMLYYAEGKIARQDVLSALESENRGLLGSTVPPHGLFLEKVHF